MVRTFNFLAPSLHPNTLLDLSFSEPKIGPSAPPSEAIVKHLPIKYGTHQPVGEIRRMVQVGDNQVVVADNKSQVSTIELQPFDADAETASPPLVTSQESVKGKGIWAGLVPVENGTVSARSSGLLTYYPFSSSSSSSSSRTVPSPLACLASSPLAPTSFALGGKEVDVSIYDLERTFASALGDTDAEMKDGNGKRKKNAIEPGQIWQAKNVPNNSLALRQPVYHLALTYLPSSPNLLVSGTKMGTVRRFDTRQRKPVSDWKVAKEGGVGCVAPGVEHELFFSDRSNLLGAIDLRTGKVLYTYSALTSTPHHLLPLPTTSAAGTRRIGLSTIASDASFRIHTSSTPPDVEDSHKNWGEGEGMKKGDVVGMVGGVGVGEVLWRGWGEREVIVEKKEKKPRAKGEEGDDEEDSDEDEEEVWEGMEEFEDKGEEESDEELSDEEDEDEEDEEVDKPKTKKAKKA
ncbi:hypothetical protein CI109_100472 [Kwoniella shandongensis]|uniref:Ribosome biogenesis protein NSA1 n=1 Tax=Kwoniella shandongensis TaxID=1734106 RepID=A0A5M6C3N4_9TREE|nr:uncharacterized protein CI109_001685 [Kwoniella shandongensis]KAA5529746.1 hypothetical protein CI109_001685 [Kwoniella shandongensis]